MRFHITTTAGFACIIICIMITNRACGQIKANIYSESYKLKMVLQEMDDYY